MGNSNSKWSREATPIIPRYTLTSPSFSACARRPLHISMGTRKSFSPNRTKQERTEQSAGAPSAPKFLQRLMHASLGNRMSYCPQRTMEEIGPEMDYGRYLVDTDHQTSSRFTPRPQDASLGSKESYTPKGSIEVTEDIASCPPSSKDASMPPGKSCSPQKSIEVAAQVESHPPNSKITQDTALASSSLQDAGTQKPAEESVVQTADANHQATMTMADTLSLDDLELEIQAMLQIQVLRGLRNHRKRARAAKERRRSSRWSKRQGIFRLSGRYRLSPIMEEASLSEVKRNGDNQKKMETLKSKPFMNNAPPVLNAPHEDIGALCTKDNSQ